MSATLELERADTDAVEVEEVTDDDGHYEIVDGVRVELPPVSANAAVFAARLAHVLTGHGMAAGVGEAYPEVLFTLPLPADRNRRPDVAFVPYSRWARHRPVPDTNAWAVLPDLCVEVVSPTDRAEELAEKVGEYLAAGVRLVWVVYPRLEQVYVFDAADRATVVGRAGTLDGGPVLPGFTLALSELFPDPAAEG